MPKGFGGSRRQLHASLQVVARNYRSSTVSTHQADADDVQGTDDESPKPAKTLKMWIAARRKEKSENRELALV